MDLGDKYSMKVEDKPGGNIGWLGRNFNAWHVSIPHFKMDVTPRAHIVVWSALCLYKNRSTASQQVGLQVKRRRRE